MKRRRAQSESLAPDLVDRTFRLSTSIDRVRTPKKADSRIICMLVKHRCFGNGQAAIKDCLHKNIGHLTEERTRLRPTLLMSFSHDSQAAPALYQPVPIMSMRSLGRIFQTDRKVHISVGIDSQDAAGQNKAPLHSLGADVQAALPSYRLLGEHTLGKESSLAGDVCG